MRGLSAKLLTLASTDNTPLDFADIPVAQLFSDVHATMAPVLGRRGIKLTTLHKNAVLHIDRELFLSLLYNLIDNAAKASPDNSEIWLIQSELDGHTVVSVIDRGHGHEARYRAPRNGSVLHGRQSAQPQGRRRGPRPCAVPTTSAAATGRGLKFAPPTRRAPRLSFT